MKLSIMAYIGIVAFTFFSGRAQADEGITIPEPEKKVDYQTLRYISSAIRVSCADSKSQTKSDSTEMRLDANCTLSPIVLTFEGEDGKIYKKRAKLNETGSLVLSFGNDSLIFAKMNPSDWDLLKETHKKLALQGPMVTDQDGKFQYAEAVMLNPAIVDGFQFEKGEGVKITYFKKSESCGNKICYSVGKKETAIAVLKITAGKYSISKEGSPAIAKAGNIDANLNQTEAAPKVHHRRPYYPGLANAWTLRTCQWGRFRFYCR